MEIGPHQGLGLLQLAIEPGRDIGEIALRRGEHRVGADERVGQALREPFVARPNLAPDNHQMLRRIDPGGAEIIPLDRAAVGKQADDRPVFRVIARRTRRAVDRLEVARQQHFR